MPGFDKAVVEDIKALEEQRGEGALEQGDLIESQVPTGADRARNGSGETLDDLAAATGISAETLRMRRFVSVRIPAHVRGITSGVAWSSYQALAYIPDEEERFGYLQQMHDADPGTESGRWTLEATLTLLGKTPKNKPAYRVSPRASLEARLEAYKRLQGDKEVLDAISRELLQAGKETPEQKLKRERDKARQEASDFKASREALAQSLAEMKARLDALEGAAKPEGEGVEAHADAETDERGEIIAGSEERVKAALEADVAYQYKRFFGPLSNFTGRHPAEDVAVAVLAQRTPVNADLESGDATRLSAWLSEYAGAVHAQPRLRVVSKEGTR